MEELANIKKEIREYADSERAKSSEWFFKTKEGEYGHGDKFLGLTVPLQRMIAKKYLSLPLIQIEKLLVSPFHEERLIAVLLLVYKYQKENIKGKKQIYEFYLLNTKHVNNWDLVDSSADKIVGDYLLVSKDISILKQLAVSTNVWERRIAIIATYQFIKSGLPEETLTIAEMLLSDKHDLIHKAVGWMLREVGKRCSRDVEEAFLQKYYKKMPRTMLRYAIEKFPEEKRKSYLTGVI